MLMQVRQLQRSLRWKWDLNAQEGSPTYASHNGMRARGLAVPCLGPECGLGPQRPPEQVVHQNSSCLICVVLGPGPRIQCDWAGGKNRCKQKRRTCIKVRLGGFKSCQIQRTEVVSREDAYRQNERPGPWPL